MITVVISSYFYGHLASHCIESILSQSKSPESIIFVDDEAHDCYHLKNIYPEIEYVFRESNLGVIENFNDILTKVESEFVMFIGADNWLRSDAIETFEYIIQHNECDIITYDILVTGQLKDELLRRHSSEIKPVNGDYYWERNGHHGSMVYRTKLGREIGYKKREAQSMYTEEDWNLWNEMQSKNAIALKVPQAFLYYRRHRENFYKY